jgi:hypothetical protein
MAGNFDPSKAFLVRGKLLNKLMKKPKGVKGQINIREDADGENTIGFAEVQKFFGPVNGAIVAWEIPAKTVSP